MVSSVADVCHSSSPATNLAAQHERHSQSVGTPPDTPITPLRLSTANRTLLVRVLNRNLAQQRQDIGSQSSSGDPLLDALPAGEDSSATGCFIASITAAMVLLSLDIAFPMMAHLLSQQCCKQNHALFPTVVYNGLHKSWTSHSLLI